MRNVLIGTLGGPELLSGPFEQRQALLNLVSQGPLDHLFVGDHVSFVNGRGMDGIVNAATLAASAPGLSICIGVYLLALRHPVTVARQLSSLALSAPGRIIFGVGIGGEDPHEYAVCGVDPHRRGEHTDHALAALTALLSGNPASYRCDFFEFQDAVIAPAPRPGIPIMIGGRSEAALRRAARFGEGWLALWCSPRRFRTAIEQIHETAAANARTGIEWRHGLQVWVGIDRDKARARQMLAEEMERFYGLPFDAFEKYSPYGEPEAVAEFLLRYCDEGCRLLNVKSCSPDPVQSIEQLARVAEIIKQEIR